MSVCFRKTTGSSNGHFPYNFTMQDNFILVFPSANLSYKHSKCFIEVSEVLTLASMLPLMVTTTHL